MVTSSAVVGSSAISSFGLQAVAMAIITRWHWPPDIWCGKDFSRSSRLGDADLGQELDRPGAARRGAEVGVLAQRLLDLEADGEAGVEARHRLLEDHRHLAAREVAALARA